MTNTPAEIEAYNHITSNAEIMAFLDNEAREKVASDIRAKTGSGTTAKAVQLLLYSGKDKSITKRYHQYLATGVVACCMIRLRRIEK